MPVLDGISAAEQIVAARIAPVVVLTAFSQRDLVARAREAGAMAYLVKPFQKKDLVPTVEMALARFAETVALEAEVADLSGRLEARTLVDRAKARLQAEHGLTEAEAFRFVQRASMDTRRSMRAVALDVLDGELLPGAGPPTGRRGTLAVRAAWPRARVAPSAQGRGQCVSGRPDLGTPWTRSGHDTARAVAPCARMPIPSGSLRRPLVAARRHHPRRR